MKLTGYEFARNDRYQADLNSYFSNGAWENHESSSMPSPARPVFADEAGKTFVGIPHESGFSALPFIPGSPARLEGGAIGSLGGFAAIDRLPKSDRGGGAEQMIKGMARQMPPERAAEWLGNSATQAMLAGAPGGMLDSVMGTMKFHNPVASGILGAAMGTALRTAGLGASRSMLGSLLSGGDANAVARALGNAGLSSLLTAAGGGNSGRSSLANMAGGQAGAALADLMRTGGWAGPLNNATDVLGGLLPGIGGVGGGAGIVMDDCFGKGIGPDLNAIGADALDSAADKLMSQWQVDDESSTAEHIAHKAVNDNKDKIKEAVSDPDGLMSKLRKFFSGEALGSGMPAVRITDVDDGSDLSLMGVGNILFEGMPVSRITDMVAGPKAPAPGKPILQGAATVLSAELPTAFLSASTAVPSVMVKGAPSILVGGAVASISPPKTTAKPNVAGNGAPSGPAGPGSTSTTSNNGGATDSGKLDADGKLDIGGYKVDPNDQHAIREAEAIRDMQKGDHIPGDPMSTTPFKTEDGYAWDPEKGMSLSPEEYNDLWDAPDWLRDIFQADGNTGTLGGSTKPGNWYLLGGLIDLGSPMNPGAGNSSAWWIPDSLFGMDMSPYYLEHDWKFRPEDYGNDGMPWSSMMTDWEIPSFLTGILSTGGNPVHMGLQVIYSGATTLVSTGIWASTRFKRGIK